MQSSMLKMRALMFTFNHIFTIALPHFAGDAQTRGYEIPVLRALVDSTSRDAGVVS